MGKYILKRILLLIPTLILVCLIVFAMLRMIPGSAVDALQFRLQSSGATNITTEEVEAMLGMDKPAATQFISWFWDVLRGDFGDSFFHFIAYFCFCACLFGYDDCRRKGNR